MNDVVRPGLALNVNDDATCKIHGMHCNLQRMPINFRNAIRTNWSREVHSHQWAEVTLGVLVRIVVAGEALARIVFDRSDILDVGGILALARHPNGVALYTKDVNVGHNIIACRSLRTHLQLTGLPDNRLQCVRHLGGQIGGGIVVVRYPAVDLVQLQEDTRRALVVRVVILLRALVERLDVHVAHLAGRRRLRVFAIEDVLTAAGR